MAFNNGLTKKTIRLRIGPSAASTDVWVDGELVPGVVSIAFRCDIQAFWSVGPSDMTLTVTRLEYPEQAASSRRPSVLRTVEDEYRLMPSDVIEVKADALAAESSQVLTW